MIIKSVKQANMKEHQAGWLNGDKRTGSYINDGQFGSRANAGGRNLSFGDSKSMLVYVMKYNEWKRNE